MNALKLQWEKHPNLLSFAILAIGMLIILYFSARHVGFTSTQWLVLGAATLALAALCVWIISWDAGDPVDGPEPVEPTDSTAQTIGRKDEG